MLNLIKYSRLRLRERTFPITPIGPSIKKGRKRSFVFSGNRLRLRLPPHNTSRPLEGTLQYNEYDRVLKNDIKDSKKGILPDQSIGSWFYGHIEWNFNGPWFTGSIGHLGFSICAYQSKVQKKGSSIFHPRAFEHTVTHFLTSYYGHIADEETGTAYYKSPVNWQPLGSNFSVPAVRFDMEPVSGIAFNPVKHFVLFPVSDTIWVSLKFTQSSSDSGVSTLEQAEKKISRQDMRRLTDEIVASLEFSLEGESLKQYEAVKKACPDMSLCEEFLPLKWPATMDSLLEDGNNAKELSKQ